MFTRIVIQIENDKLIYRCVHEDNTCGSNSPVTTLITLIYQGLARMYIKICFDVEAIFHVISFVIYKCAYDFTLFMFQTVKNSVENKICFNC